MRALGNVLIFTLLFSAACGSTWLGGIVMRDLWLWFMVPLGMVEISFWEALGIITVAGMFKHGLPAAKSDSEYGHWSGDHIFKIALYTVGYLLSWGFGAIYHHFAVLSA